QLARAREGRVEPGRRLAAGRDQRADEGQPQHQLLLYALGAIGERLEQREPLVEMGNRLDVGGAAGGELPGAVPVGNGLVGEPALRRVMSEKLGRALDQLWREA